MSSSPTSLTDFVEHVVANQDGEFNGYVFPNPQLEVPKPRALSKPADVEAGQVRLYIFHSKSIIGPLIFGNEAGKLTLKSHEVTYTQKQPYSYQIAGRLLGLEKAAASFAVNPDQREVAQALLEANPIPAGSALRLGSPYYVAFAPTALIGPMFPYTSIGDSKYGVTVVNRKTATITSVMVSKAELDSAKVFDKDPLSILAFRQPLATVQLALAKKFTNRYLSGIVVTWNALLRSPAENQWLASVPLQGISTQLQGRQFFEDVPVLNLLVDVSRDSTRRPLRIITPPSILDEAKKVLEAYRVFDKNVVLVPQTDKIVADLATVVNRVQPSPPSKTWFITDQKLEQQTAAAAGYIADFLPRLNVGELDTILRMPQRQHQFLSSWCTFTIVNASEPPPPKPTTALPSAPPATAEALPALPQLSPSEAAPPTETAWNPNLFADVEEYEFQKRDTPLVSTSPPSGRSGPATPKFTFGSLQWPVGVGRKAVLPYTPDEEEEELVEAPAVPPPAAPEPEPEPEPAVVGLVPAVEPTTPSKMARPQYPVLRPVRKTQRAAPAVAVKLNTKADRRVRFVDESPILALDLDTISQSSAPVAVPTQPASTPKKRLPKAIRQALFRPSAPKPVEPSAPVSAPVSAPEPAPEPEPVFVVQPQIQAAPVFEPEPVVVQEVVVEPTPVIPVSKASDGKKLFVHKRKTTQTEPALREVDLRAPPGFLAGQAGVAPGVVDLRAPAGFLAAAGARVDLRAPAKKPARKPAQRIAFTVQPARRKPRVSPGKRKARTQGSVAAKRKRPAVPRKTTRAKGPTRKGAKRR